MRRMLIGRALIPWLMLLMGLQSVIAEASPSDEASRMVVLAVTNPESYDASLPVLRFGELDLQRFTDAMTSVAGVPQNQVVTVKEGSLAEVRAAFAKANGLIKHLPKTSSKTKFIFYFSGHSDSSGLHFADAMLPREEFHKLIATVAADTKVVLLDSCYSGALAAKGVKETEAFNIPKAQFDEPTGAVFLAATSASDQAFEIDEIKGSLFTHYLTGGLYGLADFNQDGLITIEELYQYVYKQINMNSLALPDAMRQKPEYASRLSGRGALVMSFVSQKTSPVHLDRSLSGEITFSAKRGVQIFRLFKSAGEENILRLVPGSYDFLIRSGDQLGQMDLMVNKDRDVFIQEKMITYRTVQDLKTVAKGARNDQIFGGRVGSHVGSIWKLAPHAEMFWLSPGLRFPLGTWRVESKLGGHRSDIEYERPLAATQKGRSINGSFDIAAAGDFEMYQWWNGFSILSSMGFGTDYVAIHWDSGQTISRDFDPWMPKLNVSLGAGLLLANGHSLDFSFRREWFFATERHTQDVLSFSASLFLLGYHF